MVFGNLFKRTEPRGLSWTPRYFDPDSDEDLEEERRRTRIQFERYRIRRSSNRRGTNPFVLLAFAVLVGAAIWTMQRGESMSAREVILDPGSAVPDTTPAVIRVEKPGFLMIERDTVKAHSSDETQTADSSVPESVE